MNLQDLAGLDIATIHNLRETALVVNPASHKDDDSTPPPNEFVATSGVDLSSLPEELFGEYKITLAISLFKVN